uniref:NADH-ubiquinone oxidoreductase chain 5 n=1 Tax=Antrokoreana gracilipes TaxID=364406 RepID=A9X4I7_ANTGC|nr:NADH dehydrogenase subunit 5 [Antrokoreana gracilipes]ABC55887.1 NADH dehydrogenase subunit 5 [Antrokoreana gracilipes]
MFNWKLPSLASALTGLGGFVSFMVGMSFLFLNCSLLLEWSIFTIGSMNISILILLDWMSLWFMGTVLVITSSVLYYSNAYMEGDENMVRFIYLVLLFVVSMLMVIISPNFIKMLLGWDWLGLVSYCLVIYYQNSKSFNAGMITVLSNRVGGVGLLIAIGWAMNFGMWNFLALPLQDSFAMKWICACIIIAGLTKSAQMPFSAWLPAAMAAPTPVSALVHSSTLVTAGVYLMIRFYKTLSSVPILLLILAYIATLTSFMAGLGANFEWDLKKIIALSTLSQLGLMMVAVSLGATTLAYFHLLTHALFKALLFLCAGKIIHISGGNQDIRQLGSLTPSIPLSSVCFNLSNLSLCGMPFLAGFYSKDLILEFAWASDMNFLAVLVLLVTTALTCAYSFRVSWYAMALAPHSNSANTYSDTESAYTSPMLTLLVGAIGSGLYLSWSLLEIPQFMVITSIWKVMPLILIFGGLIVSVCLNLSTLGESGAGGLFKSYFLSRMWFIPTISSQMIVKHPLQGGYSALELGDQGWSEQVGGQGIMFFLSKLSLNLQTVQGNSVKLFIMVMVSWTAIAMLLFF